MRIRALTEEAVDDLALGYNPIAMPDEVFARARVWYVAECPADDQEPVREIIRRVNLHDELAGALRAIVARVRGEWDQSDLVAYGALRTSPETDMSLIAQQALEKATT